MYRNERISPPLMGMLLLAFTLGSSIVFIPGPTLAAAGNSAWISVLISAVVGIPALVCILYLHKLFPDQSSIQYFGSIFGRWPGYLCAVILLFAFLLMITNITVGVGSFFTSTMMVDTPVYIFNTLILVVSALTAMAGIEVMARLFTLFLTLMLITVVIVLVSDLNNYEPGNLMPQFTDGIGPILHGSVITLGFPYAEIYTFSALLFFVRPNDKQPLGKYLFMAYLTNVLVFLSVMLCAVMVFGKAAGYRKFSLYEMARVIELTGILERIESIAGITLIAGSYIKSTIALVALSSGIAALLKLKDSRTVILPLTLLMMFISLTMFSTDMEAQMFWMFVWPAVGIVCSAIVILAALVAFARFHPK